MSESKSTLRAGLTEAKGWPKPAVQIPPSTWRQFKGVTRERSHWDGLLHHSPCPVHHNGEIRQRQSFPSRGSNQHKVKFIRKHREKRFPCVRTHFRTRFPHAAFCEAKVRQSHITTKNMVYHAQKSLGFLKTLQSMTKSSSFGHKMASKHFLSTCTILALKARRCPKYTYAYYLCHDYSDAYTETHTKP